jgi:hypothetical protein
MLKVIPQIDKNSSLISLFSTVRGKILLSLLICIPLFLTGHGNWRVAPLIVFLFSIGKMNRFVLIFFLNLIFWFFLFSLFDQQFSSPQLMGGNLFEQLRSMAPTLKSYPRLPVSILATGFGISLLLGATWLVTRYFRKLPILLSAVLFICLLSLLAQATQGFPILYFCFLAAIVIVSKSIWYWCYAVQGLIVGKENRFAFYVSSIAPFWTDHFIRLNACPRGLVDLLSTESKSREQMTITQMKGLKLIYWGFFCKLAAELIAQVAWGYSLFHFPILIEGGFFHLVDRQLVGLHDYNLMAISLHEKWIGVLLQPGVYIMNECIGDGAFVVGFVRLLGFNIKRSVYKPHEATSFGQFFQRIYFYYNSILVYFFLSPFLRVTRFFKSHRLRIFAGVFFAVGIGGLILATTRNSFFLVKFGILPSLQMAGIRSFYFVAIGVISAFSAVRRQRHQRRKYQPMHFVFYYVVYAFCFSLQGYFLKDSYADILEFALSLFDFTGK